MDMILLALWGKQMACALALISGCILVILGFVALMQSMEWDSRRGPMSFRWKWHSVVALIIFVLSMLYPQDRLIYAYAVAKGGEKILELPEFEKARKLLNIKLDELTQEGK